MIPMNMFNWYSVGIPLWTLIGISSALLSTQNQTNLWICLWITHWNIVWFDFYKVPDGVLYRHMQCEFRMDFII